MIGEGGLLNALHANGYSIVDHEPDYVVVGEGRTMTMEMVEQSGSNGRQRRQARGYKSRPKTVRLNTGYVLAAARLPPCSRLPRASMRSA